MKRIIVRSINLALYLAVGFIAGFVVWFVYDKFPWVFVPIEDLRKVLEQHELNDKWSSISVATLVDSKRDLLFALNAFEYLEHIFVYLVSSIISLAIIHICEKKIFGVRAEKVWSWQVVASLLLVPILFFSSSLFDETRGGWYEFATFTGVCAVAVVWLYSFLYHCSCAVDNSSKKRKASGESSTYATVRNDLHHS